MKDIIKLRAYGKVNLTLDIIGKRDNGYHTVEMIMQQISIYDSVTLRKRNNGGIVIEGGSRWIPRDERNLAWKAAHEFAVATCTDVNVSIEIIKFIPVAAGLAGGSSDAAAVIRGLNILYEKHMSENELCEIGKRIGSDVPFCLLGGTQLATGTGDELCSLEPMPKCYIVLAKPRINVSTPVAYAAYDNADNIVHPNTAACIEALNNQDLPALCKCLHNVFEDANPIEQLKCLKNIMIEAGALSACMSGSGPTIFGIFTDKEQAVKALKQCRSNVPFAFICEPVAYKRSFVGR